MSSDGAPGFYGKLPGLGDFVSRRVARSFIDPWDGWLQAAIAASREQLGEDWLDVYLTSPIWRFALSPRLCGETGWTGVVMPSVDRVGRYFPLAVVADLGPDADPYAVAGCDGGWHARVEEIALGAVQADEFDLDTFDARVGAESAASLQVAGRARAASAPPAGSPWRAPLPESGQIDAAAIGAAAGALATASYGAYSLWWTAGSHYVAPSLVTCTGLPPPHAFGALLGGNWSAWSWHDSSPRPDTAETGAETHRS